MSTQKKEPFVRPTLVVSDTVRTPWGEIEGPPLFANHSPEQYKGDLGNERPAARGCLTESERRERAQILAPDFGTLTESVRKRLLYLLSKA